MEKRPFFQADMAGLGTYCMGGYGRIGVYRELSLTMKIGSIAMREEAKRSCVTSMLIIKQSEQ